MNWLKRSNRWATFIFILVIVMAGVNLLFAFAHNDVGGHIARALMLLLGGIILLVVPAYFLGMLVDKYKKENDIVSNVQKASQKVVQPDIVHPAKRDNFPTENKMSDKKQDNAKSKNLKPLVTTGTDAFYAQAWDEINDQNKTPVKALWARSFADAQGNESLAKANYLKLRVEQLSKEYAQNITMEKERQIELLQPQDALALEKRKLERQATLEEMEAKRKEVDRDDKFIAYNNGTVLDTSTNLMWAAKDNGQDINWYDAQKYCENYYGGGYTDWRMPTLDELHSLYDKSRKYKIGLFLSLHLTKLIRLSKEYLWASEASGSKHASFDFIYHTRIFFSTSEYASMRVIPVRSAK